MRFPSLTILFRALFRFLRRPEVVPREVEEVRGNTCDTCVHSDGLQCQKCTCFIPLKIKLSTESCPVGAWGEYFNPIKDGLRQ